MDQCFAVDETVDGLEAGGTGGLLVSCYMPDYMLCESVPCVTSGLKKI